MLIDDVLPGFDVTRVESTLVTAPADAVYRAALDIDFVAAVGDDPFIGVLFALRGIPDRVLQALGVRDAPPAPESMRLADLAPSGDWVRLGEDPGREIVFGAVGRFWNGPIAWEQTSQDTFMTVDAPGCARIVANLAVHPYSPDRVLLTYEARTAATDDEGRRGVERYWRFASPFVGLVMRRMLRAIRIRAEAASR